MADIIRLTQELEQLSTRNNANLDELFKLQGQNARAVAGQVERLKSIGARIDRLGDSLAESTEAVAALSTGYCTMDASQSPPTL